MRVLYTLALFVVAIFASGIVYDLEGSPEALFAEWQANEGINFASEAERAYRFAVFSENLVRINGLNAKYNPGTQFMINKFAHLSVEEFKATYLNNEFVYPEGAPVAEPKNVEAAPAKYDWRTHSPSVITPVKNQGACGSCWSFSTTGNVEGQWALAGNNLVSLSEQNLVDCDHECRTYLNQQACDAGCNGGLPPNAYTYIIKNGGIDTEASYPYEGIDNTCRFKNSTVGATIKSWTMVSSDEEKIAAFLVETGPLSIAVNAVEWQFYFGGVFYLPCGTSLDHAVLLVGYDTETDIFDQTMPYWIIKNSWGASWGEEGYIFLQRGVGRCGVNTYVSTSVV